MGGAQTYQRYMSGKTPENFFKEEIWPVHSELLTKLGLDKSKTLIIFKSFCKLDNSTGCVTKSQCMKFFGGRITRYNGRILDACIPLGFESGSFKDFIVCIWNFCTLSFKLLARYSWEMFDIDNLFRLEKPDIEAMYRMLYDCEEHDDNYVSQLPFHPSNEVIEKAVFIDFISKNRHIIQPAIDYRNRLRSKFGGRLMWEIISKYRDVWYGIFNETCITLEDALKAIVPEDYRNGNALKPTLADVISERQQEQAKLKAPESSEKFLNSSEDNNNQVETSQTHQRRRKSSVTMLMVRDTDAAFDELEAVLAEHEGVVFTTDELWDMHSLRSRLYALYDDAVCRSEEYWITKDLEEERLTLGVPEDHVLRMEDYVATPSGASEYNRLFLLRMLLMLLEEMSAIKTKTNTHGRSEKDIELSTALIAINKMNTAQERREKDRRDIISAGLPVQSFKLAGKDTSEAEAKYLKLVTKTATKEQLIVGAERTRVELTGLVKQRAVAEMYEFIKSGQRERQKEREDRLREIQTAWGVRNTRWVRVLNKSTEKMVLMNIDTLHLRKINTALCENCDTIFQKYELRCSCCNAPRSRDNYRFFNVLGNAMNEDEEEEG